MGGRFADRVGGVARLVVLVTMSLPLAPACRHSAPNPETHQENEAQRTAPDAGVLRGRAIVYNEHCGGAMLTDAQYAALHRPAANVTFFVLAGSHNTAAPPAARFVTDQDGIFEMPALAPGTYCLVRKQISAGEEVRLLALPPPPPQPPVPPGQEYVNEECLKRLPLSCDVIWEVGSPRFQPFIPLAGSTCPWSRPCVVYNGPLPP